MTESVEKRTAENDDLTVTDKVPQSGVLLVEGTGDAIVGTLGYEEVHGLLAESEFKQYRRAGQSSQSNWTDGSDGNGTAEGADTMNGTADSA